MDESIPPFPPPIPDSYRARAGSPRQPLGSNPVEREPLRGPLAAVEAVLRQPRRLMYQVQQAEPGRLILGMTLVIMFCSLVYGLVVGTFSNGIQLWAAPAKVAGGLMVSALICLPSLYIFTCLSGSQARIGEICGLLAGMLLLMTLLLIGFAPVAWLFSQSTDSVPWMGTLHLLFWFIATGFGLKFLTDAFAQSQARSKAALNTWIVIFLLVAVQMTTALRPIVGTAPTFLPKEKKFFLAHWSDSIQGATSDTTRPWNR